MTTAAEALPTRARVGVMSRTWRFVARHSLTVYALLAVAYLLLPIVVVILFSFNHPTGRFNDVWNRFTVDNWFNWNSVLGIQGAVQTSLEIAALATLLATALATLAAALLGFALSIDDFVITYLNAGPVQTFPIFVWGIARVAVPPQVNVVASAIFLVAIALGLGNVFWQYRSAKATRGGPA